MFGPDSGKGSWQGLNFMYENVRVGSSNERQQRVKNFLKVCSLHLLFAKSLIGPWPLSNAPSNRSGSDARLDGSVRCHTQLCLLIWVQMQGPVENGALPHKPDGVGGSGGRELLLGGDGV